MNTHVVYEIMDYMVTWPDHFHHRVKTLSTPVAELDQGGRQRRQPAAGPRLHGQGRSPGAAQYRALARWRATGPVLVKSGRLHRPYVRPYE